MKKVALLDVCLPDYFSGYHLPVIAVPVCGTITNGEMADSINEEVDAIGHDFDFTDDDYKLYDEYVELLRKNANDIFYQGEFDDDMDDSVYAYFSIINPTYVGGLMFLNP